MDRPGWRELEKAFAFADREPEGSFAKSLARELRHYMAKFGTLPLLLLALAGCFVLAGCTNDDASRRALDNMGFTQIETGGYAMFSCDEKDRYKTKFTATNSNGKRVSGAVCCGIFKNCTVRFEWP